MPISPTSVAEDCLSYDPGKLQIVDMKGGQGWILTDGTSQMLKLDNKANATDALALAKRYTAQCFIGRNNTQPNPIDYIMQYWTGDSGQETVIVEQDCIPYNPANLEVTLEAGIDGWFLVDDDMSMELFENEADAQKALNVAKHYTNQCFIGRDNNRTNRKDYIVEYWK